MASRNTGNPAGLSPVDLQRHAEPVAHLTRPRNEKWTLQAVWTRIAQSTVVGGLGSTESVQ